MKKKLITEEYYKFAICQLEKIQMEKKRLEYLSKTGAYQAHIKLSKTFQELLINLSRANSELDMLINFNIKRIISELNPRNTFHRELMNQLKIFLSRDIKISDLSCVISKNEKIEINPTINLEDSILCSIQTIIDFQRQKDANEYLFDYIKSLDEEESKCFKITRAYQKQQQKSFLNKFFLKH